MQIYIAQLLLLLTSSRPFDRPVNLNTIASPHKTQMQDVDRSPRHPAVKAEPDAAALGSPGPSTRSGAGGGGGGIGGEYARALAAGGLARLLEAWSQRASTDAGGDRRSDAASGGGSGRGFWAALCPDLGVLRTESGGWRAPRGVLLAFDDAGARSARSLSVTRGKRAADLLFSARLCGAADGGRRDARPAERARAAEARGLWRARGGVRRRQRGRRQ